MVIRRSKDRVMFINAEEGHPASGFFIVNDPVEDFEKITRLIQSGYMVRTRADAGTWEARTEDSKRFEAAIESGAQVISTDYYVPGSLFLTKLEIKI